jgi:chaperonin GroEL
MHIGTVDRVVATKYDATLFAEPTAERVQVRIEELKNQIEGESNDAILERLRDRVAKLDGKIALFKIGAATESEKEEMEYRVDDALQASRAAYRHGVVPGGGVTLLELSKAGISKYYMRALQLTAQKLFSNAYPDEYQTILKEALKAPVGYGYNLRSMEPEIVDMVKAGILDPTQVIQDVVKNATSVAAENLKVGATSLFADDLPVNKDKTEV